MNSAPETRPKTRNGSFKGGFGPRLKLRPKPSVHAPPKPSETVMKLRRNRSETILQIQPKPSATAPIGERIAERLRFLWEIVLGKGCHHASRIEQRHVELCPITERKRMTNPVVIWSAS